MMNEALGQRLTVREREIILSYANTLLAEIETPSDDVFETGFNFPTIELPTHGQEQISPSDLEKIRLAEPISPEFQGQPDLTVSELSRAAQELLASQAWKTLYEDSVPSTEDTSQLAEDLDHFYSLSAQMEKYQGIFLPLLDENIRRVISTIFTRLPKYNAKSVYEILSAGRAYGLFHRFCTQSFPTDLEPVLSQENKQRFLLKTIMSTFLPPRIRRLNAQVDKIETNNLGPEKKWRAIDKETRLNLAQEMFDHVKEYLARNPNEKVIIIEPGGGNAELSSVLASQIAADQITAGKALIVVREYSQEMIGEGREKISRANDEHPDQKLPIEFVTGTAEQPFRQQLMIIKDAILDHDETTLKQLGLTFEQAERLLDFAQDSKIIGGISTYAAGAMSTENGLETTATKIFSNLVSEVDAQDGLVIVNDFAATPPSELLTDSRFSGVDHDKVRYLQSVAESFAKTGLAHGLATAYGLWGEGVGHDNRQIWQTYLKLNKDNAPDLSFEVNLRPFALFPVPLRDRYLNIPGFMETTLRCRGRAKNSRLEL